MNKHSKALLILASNFGACGIIIAAFGAHAGHDTLLPQQLATFNKAINYTAYGSITLIGLAVLQLLRPVGKFFISGYCLAVGTVLFSGSLFLYTLAGMKALTVLTPVGGTLLIIGWLSISVIVLFDR